MAALNARRFGARVDTSCMEDAGVRVNRTSSVRNRRWHAPVCGDLASVGLGFEERCSRTNPRNGVSKQVPATAETVNHW